ncbi:MAG: prephenate dehydrogenase [Culicoidibacterales bacterium]
MKSNFNNILIIGLGLMGGSFVKKLQQGSSMLYAIDTDPAVQKLATAQISGLTFIDFDSTTILATIDLVIITLYPAQIIPTFERLEGLLKASALVIDISGIKKDICTQLQQKQFTFNYMLTHPMAGREIGGYVHSLPSIFMGANFIIISDVMSASGALQDALVSLAKWLGFEKISFMPWQTHDRQITYTSQLSHVLAVSLLNSQDFSEQTASCIGDSFRDLTRIANMNIELWETLFFENSLPLEVAISHLIAELDTVRLQLAGDNKLALHQFLEEAKQRRLSFNK